MVLSISKNEYVFNITEFLKEQEKINNRFPVPEKDFSRAMDVMFIQILEEMYEANEKYLRDVAMIQMNAKNVFNNDTIEEFIDVLMYIGSTIDTLETFREAEDASNDSFKYQVTEEFKFIKRDVDTSSALSINILGTMNAIIAIRRSIPQRKYHKPVKLSINERGEVYDNISYKLNELLKFVFMETMKLVKFNSMNIFSANNDYRTKYDFEQAFNDFKKLLTNKQSFIQNLDKKG